MVTSTLGGGVATDINDKILAEAEMETVLKSTVQAIYTLKNPSQTKTRSFQLITAIK